MRQTTKRPLQACQLEAVTSRACAENFHAIIISKFGKNASPNPDREGGFSRDRMGSRFDGDRDGLADRPAVPAD